MASKTIAVCFIFKESITLLISFRVTVLSIINLTSSVLFSVSACTVWLILEYDLENGDRCLWRISCLVSGSAMSFMCSSQRNIDSCRIGHYSMWWRIVTKLGFCVREGVLYGGDKAIFKNFLGILEGRRETNAPLSRHTFFRPAFWIKFFCIQIYWICLR